MANSLSYGTRQMFCCSFSKTFHLARNNSNFLFSPSTFTKKFTNAAVNTKIITTSTRNGIMAYSSSSLRRLDIRKPQVVLSRGFCSFSNKNNVNCSLRTTANVQRIKLLLGKIRVTTVISNDCFHSTPPRYVSRGFLVARLIALLGGRRFRKWYQELPVEQIKLVLNWKTILPPIIFILSLGTFYYISHLEEAPITKRIRFNPFSEEQLITIAEVNDKKMALKYENRVLPTTDPYYPIVSKIMERLISRNYDLCSRKPWKWNIIIVNCPGPNAFSLPSGDIYVHITQLEFVQNYDQLALVLAHEMAHTLLEHQTEKIGLSELVHYFMITMTTAIWALMPFDGLALITQIGSELLVQLLVERPYSRKLELEADALGLELAAKACVDVRQSSIYHEMLQVTERLFDKQTPQWRSTHPSSAARQKNFEKLIPKAIKIREQYRCGPLCENPRECLKRFNQSTLECQAHNQMRDPPLLPEFT